MTIRHVPNDKLDAILELMSTFQNTLNDVRSEVRTLGNQLETIQQRLTSLEEDRDDKLTPEEEADIAYDEHAPVERPVTGSSAITGGPPMMKNQAGYRYFIR
jgi:hypothetical protein